MLESQSGLRACGPGARPKSVENLAPNLLLAGAVACLRSLAQQRAPRDQELCLGPTTNAYREPAAACHIGPVFPPAAQRRSQQQGKSSARACCATWEHDPSLTPFTPLGERPMRPPGVRELA